MEELYLTFRDKTCRILLSRLAALAESSEPPASSSAPGSISSSNSESDTQGQQQAQQAGDQAVAAAAKLAQQPTPEVAESPETAMLPLDQSFDPGERSAVQKWLNPDQSELPGDFNMPIWVST